MPKKLAASNFPLIHVSGEEASTIHKFYNEHICRKSCVAVVVSETKQAGCLARVFWGLAGVSLLRQHRIEWFAEELNLTLLPLYLGEFQVCCERASLTSDNFLLRRDHVSVMLGNSEDASVVVQALLRIYQQ
jgi:hypothetical protein